jgi:23S rRNA pseudouridine2605 synthase
MAQERKIIKKGTEISDKRTEVTKRGREISKRGTGFPKKDRDYSKKDTDYPKKDRDYAKKETDYPKKDRSYSKKETDYPKRDKDYSKKETDYQGKGKVILKKETDYPKKERDFSKTESAYPKKGKVISRKETDYPKTERESPRTESAYPKKGRAVFKPGTDKPRSAVRRRKGDEDPDSMRLNKYIANSGICSRREADRMIEAGVVSVNGVVVTELGTKVSLTDKVKYADEVINREKPRYLLLNKPKGFITTVDDPENRKTVMALVANACRERIYPVGRLDRNTTGLLLFTNDGNIAKKLTHPRYGIKKIYHIEIDKNLTRADFDKISEGFKLEDDFIQVDAIEYIDDGKDKKQIGIELHSGKNRIVRRIFEHFEYQVLKLDRVYYAGLTKKNLPRGTWRFLSEQEINMLKMISSKP